MIPRDRRGYPADYPADRLPTPDEERTAAWARAGVDALAIGALVVAALVVGGPVLCVFLPVFGLCFGVCFLGALLVAPG